MKRIIDKPYYTYSAYTATETKIYVKCPKCNGLGIVTADTSNNTASFKCTNCCNTLSKKCFYYHYDVHNRCENCGKYYKLDIIEENKQHFKKLNVACPFCGYIMPGNVYKKAVAPSYYHEIRNSCEPFFNLELWFLTYFKNKPVWAINREHLDYLIDYLSADLREKPKENVTGMRNQADHLPKFMKTAKNRTRIVKLLKKMIH